MLKDSPHPFHVLGCISPISFCIESAEEQFLLQAVFDRGDCTRDFTRDEGFATPRTFVIEQNAIARAKPVALAVVYRRPIGERLRHPTSRIASKMRIVPTAVTSEVYSGMSKLTRTWLCAPRW